MEIFSNCLSVGVSIILIFSYQVKSLRKIVLIHALVSTGYAITFLMLGAYQGAAQNFISAAARIVSLFAAEKAWAKNKIWVVIFSAMYLAFGFAFFEEEGIISLLVAAVMVVYVIVLWMDSAFWFKINHLVLTSPVWIVYDFMVKNIPAALTESFTMVSIVVWLFRYRHEKKKKPQVAKE